jgi:predicted TIM-barrel fold metal-dependent hydrolase
VADPEHLLYGSDYPYTPTPIVAACKDSLEHDPLLADITEDVFSNNARRLFGLDFE